MTELELFIAEQISKLVPDYEKLEVRANVGDSSYLLEFFATVGGKKMQCYDMVDNGLINEKDIDAISKSIATFIRSTPSYEKGTINKISVVLNK